MLRIATIALTALTLAAPVLAAPVLNAKVTHNCCGQCDRALTDLGTKVPWAGGFKSDRASLGVTLTAKPGAPADVMQALEAFKKGGFPLQQVKLEGAKVLEFKAGHLCCAGCVNPLKAALAKVKTVTNVQAAPNEPVRITVSGPALDVTDLLKTLDDAGYSATSLVIVQ